jgi:succinate dehydrogenase / fumarate reductase cytochrome b subunit
MKGMTSGFSYFWLCRLHAIAGVVFAAAFVLYFLIPFSAAFDGSRSFDSSMMELARAPTVGWALAVFVLLPLIYHAAFGVLLVHGCQINAFHYGSYRNWMYALERVTGLVLIPFVIYHLYKTELAHALGAAPMSFDAMHALLAPAWRKALYLGGVACAAFYIGNGFAIQSATWGLAASSRARSAAIIVGWVVTIVLAVWGMKVVLSFS